jgi:hypothetical protein
MSTCRRLKLDPYLSLYKKNQLKLFKDLNIRPETLKLLGENTSRYRHRQLSG